MQDAFYSEIMRKIRGHQRGILGENQLKKNAVLVPLIKTCEGRLEVLFTKRSRTLRRQAGEISFPGGHREEFDKNDWETARRETHEELGVPLSTIHYAGALDAVTGHFQMMIYPFVGLLSEPELIRPNPAEVDEVFSVDLERLLAIQPDCYQVELKVVPGDDFPFHLIANGKNYAWRSGKVAQLFYHVDGHVIWGLTARILAHFLELIRPDCDA